VTSSRCCGEGCQDCLPSRLRYLKNSRVLPSSAATSSNSAGEIRSSRWAPSRPSGVLAGLGGRELEGPTECCRPTAFALTEAVQHSHVLVCAIPRVSGLGLLADHGVLHDGVAEGIPYRRDGERQPPQPLRQTFFRHGFAWPARAVYQPPQATVRRSRPPCASFVL